MALGEKLNSFLDRLLENVPADKRDAVRSDYSKAQDEVRTLEQAQAAVQQVGQQQKAWWETNKDAVAERDRLKAAAAAAPNPAQVDAEALNKRFDAVRDETLQTGLGLVTTLTTIAVQHMHEFGKPLDVRKLTEDAIKAGKPLPDFYADTVAADRAARAEVAQKAHDDAMREEGRKAGVEEVMKRIPGEGMPYPVGESAPTTLAGLRAQGDQKSQYSLDAAIATANAVAAGAAGR